MQDENKNKGLQHLNQMEQLFQMQGRIQTGQPNPHCYTFSVMDVQFKQRYEINQIKVWFYDLDGRVHSFKIILIDKDNIEKELFSGYQKQGLVTINFEDHFALQIKIIIMSGSSYNALAIIKINVYLINAIKNLIQNAISIIRMVAQILYMNI
ncbi:unnamed protein product [Paramecium primaurelia]|uniref:Uncharacterized protein n=1 Tax=Paramecium primaurelia TaxID=5886 RepID=A0A8S1QRE4_PARPR|nr:unnamed protein product [Paramecium primaurelia]